MTKHIQQVTVVLRSTGERTVKACYNLLAKQVPKNQIIIIEERPFRKAVEKTFEIGIQKGNKWTLAVDADLLPCSGSVAEMIAEAEKLPHSLFAYQGMILDYILGSYRFGGLHLYQTNKLNLALKKISNNPFELRPESFTYKKMAIDGYPTYCDNKCYALHDFEQFKKDYYRKGYFHSIKTNNQDFTRIVSYARSQITLEDNFKYVLSGLLDGILDQSKIKVDIKEFDSKWEDFLRKYNGKENIENLINTISENFADETITSFNEIFPNKIQTMKAYKLIDDTIAYEKKKSIRNLLAKALYKIVRKIE